ncbi:MAG: sporulation protein [Phaeodactylibacter sp.]|nr:sporulation protein [Phaeodactylibacter sp.]MCB9297775.1 sporulation protein [Lewinellaceae bacterium]
MLGKVKKWLGIEGVKLELILPEEVDADSGEILGSIRFQSLNPQTVTSIKIAFIEKYARGRGKEKLIDEYELGASEIHQVIEVPAEEAVEVPFQLPFSLVRSNVDEFGRRNFLFGGLALAAKALRGVNSEFRVEAEAQVAGVALNPFDRKSIRVRL